MQSKVSSVKQSSDTMASRKRVPLHQRKAERSRMDVASNGRPSSKDRTAKKLCYSRARNLVEAGKRYNARDYAEQPRNEEKKIVESDNTIDPIFVLRQEINDWRVYEALTNRVKDKIERIESAGTATETPSSKSRDTKPPESPRSRTSDRHERGIFATEPEPEPRTAAICDEKLPSGSTSGCAAGGQTTGRGKRAVVSHVQTGSGDRSSPRVPRGNCAAPVNDRDGGMKKLEDYLPSRARRRTPAKLSKSPILSPDTANALDDAERLVKEAQKIIIEASYDIDSSPEREKSIGSARERETKDEAALYIRDIVSTRFHEANESARLFTRPSTRPLAERLCRPEVRRGRARRLCEGTNKTRTEKSTIRRSKPLRSTSRTIEKNFDATRFQNSFRPQRSAPDEETTSLISKTSMTSAYRSPGKVADHTSLSSFKVQEGPRIDIRNELTVTDVENVDISPKSRSSLPVRRNIKTYEFRHESCVKDIVPDASRTSDEALSTERETGVSGPTRRSPEVAEESADPLRSCAGAGPAPDQQGSRSDLVGNKSGRSIRPEPLEGRADNTRISKRGERSTEHDENHPESFIDFLRRATNDETPNLCEDAEKAEALRNKVLRSLNTKDKIDIFDRAIDEFFDEFKRGEGGGPAKKNSPRSCQRRVEEDRSPERDVVDGDRVDDEKSDDFAREALEGLEGEPEVFGDDWDPEDIKLEPPNFGDLEKTVRRFDSTIEKILRDTRSLGVLMSRYCIEAEVAELPEVELTDREPRSNNPTPFCPTPAKDFPANREQKKTAHVCRKKAPMGYEDYKTPISGDEDLTGSSEDSRGIRMASGCKASREAKLGQREHKFPGELGESRPRFSTPLNDGSRIIASSRRSIRANADFRTEEFERFLIGIERPKCGLQKRRVAVTDEPEVYSGARRNALLPAVDADRRKKIVLDRIDRNCNFDTFFDRDRRSAQENEGNSHETVTFPTYTAREKRGSSDPPNSGGRSLIQDSAIGRTTDQSEKISLGTKVIDERVARKDSGRSERSAPMRKDSARSSPSTKTLTVKNFSVDVAAMADVEEVEGKAKPTEHDGTKRQRSKGEETSEKNRLAGSAGSSPRDRTSFDVSTVYSDDFEEPVVSNEKLKSEEKIESTRLENGKHSIFKEKKSSAIFDDRDGEVEEGKSVPKNSGEKFESTKNNGQSSICNEKKPSSCMDDRNGEVEDGKTVLKKAEEKLESTNSDRQNSNFIEEKSSAMIDDRNREVEDGKSVLKKTEEELESTNSDRQNLIFIEEKSSAMMDDRNREVEDGKTVLTKTEEKLESTNSDRQNSIFIEEKSSAMMDDRNREVENGISVLKKTEEKLESMKSDRQTSIFKERKSSAMMEVADGKTVRSPRESSQWPRPHGESREETKYPEKSFSVSVNESSDRNKDDDERRLSEEEGSVENNSEKKEADPDSGEVSEKSSVYRGSVLSSSGTIKASGTSSLLRESQRKGIKAADACSENYSEGELYLPSSCSYSLGEIRISERPSYGTVGTGIESSSRNSDGIRIFFPKSYATLGSSDRTINAPNTAVQSPGEVQETDVESICSSRGLSSSGEHRQGS